MSEDQEKQGTLIATVVDTFVDSLGVVLARLIVAGLFAVVGVIPYLVLAFIIVGHSAALVAAVSAYSFLALTVLLTMSYFYILHDIDLYQFVHDSLSASVPRKALALLFSLVVLPTLPALLFPILMDRYLGNSFAARSSFKAILVFIVSVILFSVTVYAVGLDTIQRSTYLLQQTPPSFLESLTFTIDLSIKGLFLDVFEHFGIKLTPVEQSDNLVGLFFSFILRTSASVMAISIVLWIFRDVGKRLRRLNDLDKPAESE